MDKNTIISGVLGFITLVLGSCIGWLFNSITTLQHENNLQGKDIIYNKENNAENKAAIAGAWEYLDEKAKEEKAEVMENYRFANEIIDDQHRTEIAIKDLEIKLLESEK